MSGWTEYIIADKKDAAAIADSNSPQEKWRGFEGYKFFGPILLAPLCEILGEKPASYEDFPELAFGETGWVYELPEAMSKGIQDAEKKALGQIAEEWSKRLADMKERYTTEELLTLLSQIRDLLLKAKKARKPVLLWQSSTG
jgi:hypothetical protein